MNIVILDGQATTQDDLTWDPLQDLGILTVYPRTSPYELIERAQNADILLTNKVPLGKDILDMLTNLKYISVLATGYSIIDTDYCKILGIPVSNIPAYSTDTVAQHVFSFILHESNQVSIHNQSVKQGEWLVSKDFSYFLQPLKELRGKTLGLIGYGAIAKQVELIARAFGMEVLISKKSDGSRPSGVDQNTKLYPVEELPELCDYISLHCPLTTQTKGFFSGKWLSKANNLALINTARGGLIDPDHIVDALTMGNLRAYWSDVYDPEPPKSSHDLLTHPKVLFTPHIAWGSFESRKRLIEQVKQNIIGFLNGTPINLV
jgi:glycerate dehydrogenase